MMLQELGRLLGAEIKGDGEYKICGVRDYKRATADKPLEENYIYFIESTAMPERHPPAITCGAVLTTAALAKPFPNALIATGDLRLAFINLLKLFDKTPAFKPGICPGAHVDPSARIGNGTAILPGSTMMEGATVGSGCIVYPGVVVEPFAAIGDNTVLHPNAVVGHHCVIGQRCIVHGGSVIGADGFGFYDDKKGRYKISQIGNVVIKDDVEIGANCTVDRATIESTTIGAQTKIDDQVHIGHNCQIGRSVYIAGNTALAGSVVVEDGVSISGAVAIRDHVHLAQGSMIGAMSGVASDTEAKQAYLGIPARPVREMRRMMAALTKLPMLIKKVRELEAKSNRRKASV